MAVVALLSAMPLEHASALFVRVWRFSAIRAWRQQLARASLKMAIPELTQSQRNEIACKMSCSLGCVMAETMDFDRLLLRLNCIKVRNPKLLKRYWGKIGPSIPAHGPQGFPRIGCNGRGAALSIALG